VDVPHQPGPIACAIGSPEFTTIAAIVSGKKQAIGEWREVKGERTPGKPREWNPRIDVCHQFGSLLCSIRAPELRAMGIVTGLEKHAVANQYQLRRVATGWSWIDILHTARASRGAIGAPELPSILAIISR
jgi:hypothetical protein